MDDTWTDGRTDGRSTDDAMRCHCVLACQQAADLLSALQQLPEFDTTKHDQNEHTNANTNADADAPMTVGDGSEAAGAETTVRPKAKGKRSRAARKAAEGNAHDSDDEQAQAQAQSSPPRQELSAADVESTSRRAAGARNKSQTIPVAVAAEVGSAADPEAAMGAAGRDRVTKRGRRPKRVTVSEADTLPTGGLEALPTSPRDAPAAAAASRTSTRNDKATSSPPQQHHAPQSQSQLQSRVDDPSPSPIRSAAAPRPSMGVSARKRWSHATVELFGTVLAPPASVLAAAPPVAAAAAATTPAVASRPSSKWQAPLAQIAEPAHRRSRSKFEFGSGGSGSHGPTSLAPDNIREHYAAQHSHSRAHNTSPSRAGLLMAAAARAQASPPASGSSASAYRSAYSPSPARASALARLPTPSSAGIPPLPSPPAPLISARTNGPAEVASRLSFSQFSPEKVAAAAAAAGSATRQIPSPSKKLPQTLFTSAAYHAHAQPLSSPTTAAGSLAAGARKTGAAAAKARPAGTATGAGVGLSATAGPGTLFSREARSGRVGAAAPRGSPAAAGSQMGRKSFSATAGPLSLAGMAGAGAATVPDRPKFDLQASLQRPVGWKLKTGSLRQGQAATAAAAAAAAAPAAAAVSSNPSRTTQLKAREFASTKPAQRAAQEKQQQVARQARIQQARDRQRK